MSSPRLLIDEVWPLTVVSTVDTRPAIEVLVTSSVPTREVILTILALAVSRSSLRSSMSSPRLLIEVSVDSTLWVMEVLVNSNVPTLDATPSRSSLTDCTSNLMAAAVWVIADAFDVTLPSRSV